MPKKQTEMDTEFERETHHEQHLSGHLPCSQFSTVPCWASRPSRTYSRSKKEKECDRVFQDESTLSVLQIWTKKNNQLNQIQYKTIMQ